MEGEILQGLNSQHLAKGSSSPPKLVNGKIRLYSMRFCPYAERAMIALLLKEIPCYVININLKHKPDWYFQLNPLGKVPCIEHDGKFIYESLVIAEYLDQVFSSGKKLLPDDPYQRAHQKMILERVSGGQVMYKWIHNREDPAAIQDVKQLVDCYESLLQDDYFSGPEPCYVDYMVWPWMERLDVLQLLSHGELGVIPDKHPKLVSYIAHMLELPEIKSVALDGQTLTKFVESNLSGIPNYEGILNSVNSSLSPKTKTPN